MPAWKCRAISWQAETMKLMSGSLVLRSGVGTQMLMVSSSSTTEKSVVARSLPASTSGPSVGAADIADVGIAGVDAAQSSPR